MELVERYVNPICFQNEVELDLKKITFIGKLKRRLLMFTRIQVSKQLWWCKLAIETIDLLTARQWVYSYPHLIVEA